MSKKVDIRPTTKHLVACDGDHAAAWVLAAIEFATKIGGWKGRQRLAEACMVDIVTLDRKVKKLEEFGYIMHPQREQKTIVYRVTETYQNDMYKHIKMICETYQNDMFEHIKMICDYNNIVESNIENIIGKNNTHTHSACEGLTDIDTLFYELKNDLQNATQISEDAQRNFKKTPAEILAALDEFQRMQRISGVTTDTRRNYRTHFNNWMYQQIRIQNQNKRNNNNGNNNELPARLRVSKPVGPAQSTCDF